MQDPKSTNIMDGKNYNTHRIEWAIHGANCSVINKLANLIQTSALPFTSLFIDKDHLNDDHPDIERTGTYLLTRSKTEGKYEPKLSAICNNVDFILTNGNHHPATEQIIIYDPRKAVSLQKHSNEISRIAMIILLEELDVLPDWLRQNISKDTPIFNYAEEDEITSAFKAILKSRLPKLKALILAGGKSKRMGLDKSSLHFHEKSQLAHLTALCNDLNLPTFQSLQTNDDNKDNILIDRIKDVGPLAGIISAFMHDNKSAWLVIACDLPFLSKKILSKLIKARDPSKYATTLQSQDKSHPEPLVAIYEPKAFSQMLNMLSIGIHSPLQLLESVDVKKLIITDKNTLMNVNTPGDRDIVEKIIKESSQ